ncbi:MAG: chitinase [Ktedonobacteraceae bacterium]|nr:chitinase [Ktedonobacteraceae bacterium]
MKISRRYFVAFTVSGLIALLSVFWAGLSVLSAHAAGAALPAQVFAPYQDMTIGTSLKSVAQSTGQKYFTLAFITSGGGCKYSWGSSTPTLASDLSYIRSQGGDVLISFGGAAGTELALDCNSPKALQAQYQKVINTYKVTHLDFDIEGGTEGDATSYTRRNTALAALQKANPGLTIDFTLPSNPTGPTSEDMGLLKNAKAKGVNFSVVNLMTMDYNGPDNHMGKDAIAAAKNLFAQLKKMYPTKTTGELWSMVGLTNLIGQNDTPQEIFTLNDAKLVLNFAQQNHIGLLSFWEVSRDNGSCPGNTSDQDTCSGLSQSTNAFTNIFKAFTN